MQEKRKRKLSWSSAIGWIIFILVFAGAPLLKMLQQLLGGALSLPPNSVSYIIGGLVALSLVISVLRAIAQASRGRSSARDTRLPSGLPPSSNTPMPPFGGPSLPAWPPAVSAPRTPASPVSRAEQRQPISTRFEPIFNPIILIVGLAGIVVIGGIALFVLGQNLP